MIKMRRAAIIAAKVAMIAQAAMWIVFAVLRLVGTSGSMNILLAVLMIANGMAFAVLGCFIHRRSLLLSIVTIGFLAVNLILTVTDQMGVMDWVVLALNAVSLCGAIVLWLPEPGGSSAGEEYSLKA